MDWSPRSELRRARRQLREDLSADPYLLYILGLAVVLAGFWIWHLLPNFATRDERWRVLHPLRPIDFWIEDKSMKGIERALQWDIEYWRDYGGTFFLYGLAFVPILALLRLTGDSNAISGVSYSGGSLWNHWLGAPGDHLTAFVLVARLVNVALAVGSVYVVYRIGTHMRDRDTGRLAALLTSLTWGLLILAHEAGEDVPALFFFLLSVYFVLKYVDTGARRPFYYACLAGGLAAGIKLSAGIAGLIVGFGLLQRGYRSDGPIWSELLRLDIVGPGLVIGLGTIFLSYPSTWVGHYEIIFERIDRGSSSKSSVHGWRDQASWWWILRGYLHGLGLPLFLASVGGVLASVSIAVVPQRTRQRFSSLSSSEVTPERATTRDGIVLALVGLGLFLVLFDRWSYVRTHHLLLTFPLLVVVLSVVLTRVREHHPDVGRYAMAALLVSTGMYAIGGDLAYASQPRAQATEWIANDAGPNATVETYPGDPQEAAVPHGMTVYRPSGIEEKLEVTQRCPDYIVLNYFDSILRVAPDEYNYRTQYHLRGVRQDRYVEDLLAEDTYPYEVVGRFGREPRFMRGLGQRSTLEEMLHVGTRPRTHQYGDPQDMGVDQYTIVLKRDGSCTPDQP